MEHAYYISSIILTLITAYYAFNTHRMLQSMRVQARIQAISAELAILNLGTGSRSGSASSERMNILLDELHTLSAEH